MRQMKNKKLMLVGGSLVVPLYTKQFEAMGWKRGDYVIIQVVGIDEINIKNISFQARI